MACFVKKRKEKDQILIHVLIKHM